ncbi:tetratricopeptide repeat protein [Roseovarius sp. B08]|uniref:tetratricopeptide repeat protein n=1 Tax=Roseovarius sp. B08 TaxID=3449223 RepID=UPI003EDBE731
MRILVIACVLAGPAWAGTCPEAPDHSAELSRLIDAAQDAPDEAAGRALSDKMWALWAEAPDAKAQGLLDEAMARREAYDHDAAMTAAEALVAYCPDYAEGYNQRAFIHFLRQDFEAALPDLARAVELQPRHVAARTGQALTLHALGRNGEAALALRRALALNPWLGERHLLPVLEQGEEEL